VGRMNLKKQLDACSDFASVFELVRLCVDESLGRRRNGLMLGMTDLPLHIGAYHAVPSNFIMLNRKLLNAIAPYDKKLTNSYLFHVLLHEYLHTLGFMNEEEVSAIVYVISKNFLGERHPSTLIAKHGIGAIIQSLQLEIDDEVDRSIEIIENFDNENLNYFG
jgi:hypothetical protein